MTDKVRPAAELEVEARAINATNWESINRIGVSKLTKPLVCRHQAFHVAPSRFIHGQRPACQHHLKDMEQLLGHLAISLIAGAVKGHQDLVR